MVFSRTFEFPDLLVATVGGVVTPRDQAALVEWVRDMVQTLGTVRLLVRLHRFAGWKPDVLFSDAGCWLQDHDPIEKMAIVGDAEWRLAMLTFIAQPLRRTPIEYFETERAARRWLDVPTAAGGAEPI